MYVDPNKILKVFEKLCGTHRGEMHSAYLDWEVVEVNSPRFDQPVEYLVPLFVIDFK